MKKMFTRLDNAICKNYKKREQNMEEVRNLLIEKYPKERQDSLEKLYGIFSKHCYEIVKYGFYINALLVSDAKDYRGLRLDIGRVKYELPGLVLRDLENLSDNFDFGELDSFDIEKTKCFYKIDLEDYEKCKDMFN